MKTFTLFSSTTGRWAGFSRVPEIETYICSEDQIAVPGEIDTDHFYDLSCGEVKPLPPRPSIHHEFNYQSKQWLDTRTVDSQWVAVREQRSKLLQESDWTDTHSAPDRLGEQLYEAWQAYRQALRDVTLQQDPFNIVWPEPPTK